MIRLGAWAAPVLAAFLVSACGEVRDREEHVDERAQEPAASEGQAGPILHLVIDGRSQTYLGSPSCMTQLQVENRSLLPLDAFFADFKPSHAQTGAPLAVLGMRKAAVPDLTADRPLRPGARGRPWQMHVIGAPCDQIVYRLGPLRCGSRHSRCSAVTAEYRGVAEGPAPRIAASGS